MLKHLSSTVAGLCIAFSSSQVMADGVGMPGAMPASYKAECASCHTLYAPGLLPAKSWLRVMSTLDKHFGSDASIDQKSNTAISAWLQANGATSRKFAEAPKDNRITSSAWFERKHDEVGKNTWLRPSIKSRSNCSACHQQAARGDFEEDSVRIPR